MSQSPAHTPLLDSAGRERPAFVATYPTDDPRLTALVAAFERGDFRAVNQGAKTLLAAAPSQEVRLATQDLQRRTQPHPLVVFLLTTALLLCVSLVAWAYAGN